MESLEWSGKKIEKQNNSWLRVLRPTVVLLEKVLLLLLGVEARAAQTSVRIVDEHLVKELGRRERKRLLTQHHVLLAYDHRLNEQLSAVLQVFDLGTLYHATKHND